MTAIRAGDLTAGQAVSAPSGDLSGPLAGRSSAIGDGTSSSFAGQHLTQLNVLGAEAALAAVLAVGCSADSQSAAAYRSRMGAADARGCGVVVQARVPADVAGVMFTRNPVTGVDERVIEAGWALGEAVVAGLVTPTATG